MPPKITIEADFDDPVVLLAIFSQSRDYMLAYHINEQLGLSLIKQPDIEFHVKKKNRVLIFSRYLSQPGEDALTVDLMSNKFQGESLLPELKIADFLLLIRGPLSEKIKTDWLDTLKKTALIQTVFESDLRKLKSKRNLLFG